MTIDWPVKPITFAEFSRVLTELGFTRGRADVNGPKVVFRHEPTDTVVILPPLRANQRVPDHHVVTARVVLPDRGVTSLRHLDELLFGTPVSKA